MKKSEEVLKQKKMRLTAARENILDLILKSSGPICVLDLKKQLKRRGLVFNKTTLYRELESLVKADLISPVSMPGKARHFEAKDRKHHHHAVCRSCGKIQEVDSGAIEKLMRNFEKSLSREFSAQNHSLTFYGICAGCVRART